MEINIHLNDLKYRYDVYQMFNIYFPLDNINFGENGDYKIIICDEIMRFTKGEYTLIQELAGDKKSSIKKVIFNALKELTGDDYPWGTLVGIRPSKIALKELQEGSNEEEIVKLFKDKHEAHKEKAELCIEVAKLEEKFVNQKEDNIAIYVGMAFCPTRCVYCSFASNPIGGNKKQVEPYLNALTYEINEMSEYVKERELKVESVYFGGGTPTAVNDDEFEAVMKNIFNCFVKGKEIKEFTVECGRPDSITENKLMAMKKYDVTRISINPQTMNDETLKLIGRNHTSQDVIDTYNMARNLGFRDINMDMIIGLPGEGLEEAEYTAQRLKELSPDSLTVHGLSLKRGSRLYENFILKKGLGIKPQEEVAKMYKCSENLAKDLDLKPYYMYRQKNMVGNMENLGYAKEGKECIYNMQMIEDKQTIIALGADAVSKVVFLDENRIERFANVKDLREYINRVEEMVEGKKALLDTLFKKEDK